jgi:tryptophan-rich sensory protein
MPKYLVLVLFVIGCLLIGYLGSFYTIASIPTWYSTLNKPFFSPPNWIFAPVWTVLYILMAVAAFRIWDKRKKEGAKWALKLFGVQLVINAIWSPIFFGANSLSLAFVVIIVLLYLIFLTKKAFAKVDKASSYLLYPYILWVSFASVLNFSVWILNR